MRRATAVPDPPSDTSITDGLGPVAASTTARRKAPRRPHARREQALIRAGQGPVVGLDEVGRGAWAGPASVGAAVFAPGRRVPVGLRDSKQLGEARREELFAPVAAWCLDWSVGHVTASECDELGMTAALGLAGRRALAGLAIQPAVALLDGGFDYLSASIEVEDEWAVDALPEVHTVVHGDATCVSMAAASVLAKVTRDRLMRERSGAFPGYDFDRNKGYPSPTHRRALARTGLTAEHRRTWSYAADLINP